MTGKIAYFSKGGKIGFTRQELRSRRPEPCWSRSWPATSAAQT